jgi:tetratricopeptide (TPR) repeat protein
MLESIRIVRALDAVVPLRHHAIGLTRGTTAKESIMGWTDWFGKRPTAFQKTLQAAVAPGADVEALLRPHRDHRLRDRGDGQAVCQALEHFLRQQTPEARDALYALVGAFQNVDGRECPAFEVLQTDGIPLLCGLVDEALADSGRLDELAAQPFNHIMLALKVAAMYGTAEGTDVIVRAALRPLFPENYMWSVVLSQVREGHPQSQRLFAAFGDSLPQGFIAVALVDAANGALLDGMDIAHPFSSADGLDKLERWLRDTDKDSVSYAVVLDRAGLGFQVGSAWAPAKLGREGGLRWLARLCLDVNQSATAKHYLRELGREDAIPAEALDDAFQAKAQFAQWLAHPSELGRAPDEVEVVDSRELAWPPDGERRRLRLIKYRVRTSSVLEEDDVDVGLVGSVTFCLFSYKLAQRPPEDCYAIHAAWEMESAGLIRTMDVDPWSREYDAMLKQWTGDALEEVVVTRVAELSPELRCPQGLVAMATAQRAGAPGWVVLDGPRSAWYASAEMPADVHDGTVLKVHIGRALLGFSTQPNRASFLAPPRPAPDPQAVVEAYEALLQQAREGDATTQELLVGPSVFGKAFPMYVDACVTILGGPRGQQVVAAYEKLLAAATVADASLHGRDGRVFNTFTPVGDHWEDYVEALLELGRTTQVKDLVVRFEPFWQHNQGYGKLGAAAFKAGDLANAERLLNKLRMEYKDAHRSDTMSLLAEVWSQTGRLQEAKELLIHCMQRLQEEGETHSGRDRAMLETSFQRHRTTYLRLFPHDAAELG